MTLLIVVQKYLDRSNVATPRTCVQRIAGLVGCGKTILVQQNFDGPLVWGNRRTLLQDSRARHSGSGLARRALERLADFFSILLEEGGYDAYSRKILWDRPAR
jgi:hypothetical protein